MTVCFVNGCFDVLHVGHVRLFKFAKKLADQLIVAVDSDERIRGSKGLDRPYNNLEDRIEMLSSIRFIDKVLSFDSNESLEKLIKNIKPDVMVVGSDWQNKDVIGSQYAGKVKFFRRIDGYSTTKILENSLNR